MATPNPSSSSSSLGRRPGSTASTPSARKARAPVGSVTIEEYEELQDDFEILRRKVRLLEDSQATEMKKHQIKLSQTQSTIERLRKDNKRLREDLMQQRSELSMGRKREPVSEIERIMHLQEKIVELRHVVDSMTSENRQLKAQTEKMAAQLVKKQEEIQYYIEGDAARSETLAKRRIAQLEHRLDVVKKHANEKTAEVEKHKTEIQDFSVERQSHEASLRKLQRQLRKKDKDRVDLEDKLREALAGRDAAQSEVAALMLQFEREKEQWQSEMRDVTQRLVANVRMSQRLMDEKDRKAISEPLEKEERPKSSDHRERVKREAAIAEGVAQDKELLSRLQKAYATSTPALAIDKAIQSEDAVYSLLRRISQLEEELKSANQQNEVLQKQVDASATSSYDESHEGEKGSHQLIKSMEDRTTEAEAAKQRAINKYEQLSKVYIEVKAGVIALCEKVGVDMEEDAVATADTSITTSVLDRRVLDYLSSLEKRILELIDFESRAQKGGLRKSEGGAYMHELPGSPAMPTPKRSASVINVHNVSKFLNQMVDESDSEDEFLEVMDREKLKQASLKRVKEKEAEEVDERRRKSHLRKTSKRTR